jgi:hypothetical protein
MAIKFNQHTFNWPNFILENTSLDTIPVKSSKLMSSLDCTHTTKLNEDWKSSRIGSGLYR